MGRARSRRYRTWAVVPLLVTWAVNGIGMQAASADVTAVKGSAFGYLATNFVLLGGAQTPSGPAPTVTLPAEGSSTPLTNTAASALVRYGPATIFTSGESSVRTQGTTGPSGSVTSSASVSNLNTSGQEVLTAGNLSSTCNASESGRTGSTTITGGKLIVSEGADVGNPADDTVVDLPANPSPGTEHTGKIETVGDTFRAVFNEQIVGSDGSITVNGAHIFLLGPTATGEVIVAQSVCGVTAGAGQPRTQPGGGVTTTAAPTTSTSQATTTTAPSSTTSTAPAAGGTASGGAYGFFLTVSIFGGPASIKGPEPTVTLPAGGSASPVTANAPSGIGQFGPATLYTSDALTVSTQGTPGGTVTSSARVTNLNKSTVHAAQTGGESFTADTVSSTCSSSTSGETGSTNLAGGRLTTSAGTNFDSKEDDTVVPIPADPAPNTAYEGKLESVGDTYRVVFNEQEKAEGSITVNAVHMYLLGPTAKGELIIGQSRCGRTASTAGTGGTTATTAGGSAMASTGAGSAGLVALAVFLVAIGAHVRFGPPSVRWAGPDSGAGVRRRAMPWGRRGRGAMGRSPRRRWS